MDVDKNPPSVPPLSPRHADLARIERELAEVYWALFEERRQKTGVDGTTPRSARVRLELELHRERGPEASSPRSGRQKAHAESVLAQLTRAAERDADASAVFPAGRVYCHWSKSFQGPGSTPPSPRCVFAGYTATGQPIWRELSSVLLDRADPRVELVYRDPPVAVSLVQGSRELLAEQLASYGRRSSVYRVLGQVIVGYFVAPARVAGRLPASGAGAGLLADSPARPRELYAVTLQAVQGGHDTSPVFLNVIGTLSDGTPVREILEEASDRVFEAIVKARRQLAEIRLDGLPRRRRQRELFGSSFDALRRLARQLERVIRQRGRRTIHARDRHRDAKRPTSKALDDALGAKPGAIYRDIEERTWVVVGPKSRVHVFNDAGAHVTSVVYPGETIRHRTTRGKWIRPAADEVSGFVRVLRARNEPDAQAG